MGGMEICTHNIFTGSGTYTGCVGRGIMNCRSGIRDLPTLCKRDQGPTLCRKDQGPAQCTVLCKRDQGPALCGKRDQGPALCNMDQGPALCGKD